MVSQSNIGYNELMQFRPAATGKASIVSKTPFYYGWVILVVSALGYFVSGPGQTYSVSIFVDPIISELSWSRTMVSGLYTAGSLTAGVIMILAGRLLDRYGSRIMMTSVGALFGFAALWMSSVDDPLKLYIGFAAIRTLGQGSLSLIPGTLIALWFVRRRGKATAIGSLGGALSQAVFPPLIHTLIIHNGWRQAWVMLGFIIWTVLLLPTVFLVRRNPESVGLLPDNQSEIEQNQAEPSQAGTITETNLTLKQALRTRSFWLLLFAGSAQNLIVTALIFHHVSLRGSKGISSGVAASVFSIMAPMFILGNFTAGFLADKFPNRYLLAIGQLLLATAMLSTFIIDSTWQAFVYGAAIGLSSGFLMNVFSVIWPNYYGRLHLGSIRGTVTAGMVAFAALGPLPFGFIFDLTSSYSRAILIFLTLPIACAVAGLMARPPLSNQDRDRIPL